jgi:hypothetical protein
MGSHGYLVGSYGIPWVSCGIPWEYDGIPYRYLAGSHRHLMGSHGSPYGIHWVFSRALVESHEILERSISLVLELGAKNSDSLGLVGLSYNYIGENSKIQ